MDTTRRNEKSDAPFYAASTSQAEKDRVTKAGRSAMATIEDDDERLLARIGYKQVRLGAVLFHEGLLTLLRS